MDCPPPKKNTELGKRCSMEIMHVYAKSNKDVLPVVSKALQFLGKKVGIVTTIQHLHKMEEVKEFAITKFEKKMSKFNQPNVLDSYMGHLSGEDFDDIVLTEQFASRVVFEDNPEIKERMNSIRDKSVEEFTKRFTDPDSQAQVAKFQELERILEKKPGDPKVMKMMQELEAQVRSDPTKAEFLNQMDQLEDKMRFEFEAKFRDEGDRYFDRIGTLDPRDFEVYKTFSGEDFLPNDLADRFFDHGVNQYRDYMRGVNDPEQFDRFNGKFSGVSQFVIDDIKNRDSEFGDAMQFKRQAMEKLRFEQERQLEIDRQAIDYKERELFHQLDRARRQADEDFWRKVNSIPYENFDERKALFDEKKVYGSVYAACASAHYCEEDCESVAEELTKKIKKSVKNKKEI